MPSLRELRRKIKTVKSTQQITKAMKMVAAARLRRAQARILAARPFAQKMEDLMTHLLLRMPPETVHPLVHPREGSRRALLLVTSDKGLCGAFNTNLIREALRYVRRYGMENVDLYVIGRKGRDYFRRFGMKISGEHTNIFNQLGFVHAELVAADLLKAYSTTPIVAVDLLYNEFKSVAQQRVVVKQWLPLQQADRQADREIYPDYIYEPKRENLLEGLILRFLKAQIFRVLLESNASELGARMSAMENATKNARELMASLTLRLNRSRQASITKEILEVVSGAEALK